jgi:hypothetical protein
MSSEMAANTIGQQAVAQLAQQLVAQIRAIKRTELELGLDAAGDASAETGGLDYEF